MENMEKNYEQQLVEAFTIPNYQGTQMEKLALSEIASQMFLATDYKLGEPGTSRENFNLVCNELIGAVPTEEIPMSLVIAARTFGLSPEALMDYSSARYWYERNQEAFDSVYGPMCEYANEHHPEMASSQQR